jgi:glycosyltransferase involved in cell wall biosynthesis
MKLSIAIPTYNRARRLDKSLADLLRLIIESRNRNQVSVFISNNGSLDDTEVVIGKNHDLFQMNGIPFKSRKFDQNQGFDANVLACYAESETEYVWFLSDDDNVIVGSIDSIISDIDECEPSVIFYNHDQKPFDSRNPYIKRSEFFEKLTFENLDALKKIIDWPKLTSLVIKKTPVGLQFKNINSHYAHVALSVLCGLAEGRVLHSTMFTAYPDPAYQENIDSPPYIGNYLNATILHVLQLVGKTNLYDYLSIKHCDPLASSLNVLGAFYRGKHVLSPALRCVLVNTIKSELSNLKLNKVLDTNLHKELLKFGVSILYCVMHIIFTGRKPMRLRS